MTRNRRDLESRLAYRFVDDNLLQEALTHRSAPGVNNERLEFLGDAILDAVISTRLYWRSPDADEGELSRLRAALVNKRALAALAADLDLGEFLKMGGGELKSGGYRRASILADALEALIGAVYLDGGQVAVEAFIDGLFEQPIEQAIAAGAHKDAKTRLQERLQKQGLPLPAYEVMAALGPDHERKFKVACSIPERRKTVEAEGSSRRRAEQRAARAMLEALEDD